MTELEARLYAAIHKHLLKLREYKPAHGRQQIRLDAAELRGAFSTDPVYSIFGLDSPQYISAALAGGTITSIHRKIGDAYEECIRIIFSSQYGLSDNLLQYAAMISSGDRHMQRSLDVYFALEDIPAAYRTMWIGYTQEQLKLISAAPRLTIDAVGLEVRHCYQSADSKRAQADEAMGRHCIISGILPIMLVFCEQSNRSIINRYRSIWIVVEGYHAYDLVRTQAGFDFYTFLLAHRDSFRQPVLEALESLRRVP